METKRRGIFIEVSQQGKSIIISLTITGKITHEDYETITPIFDSALRDNHNLPVCILVDCRKLEGCELHAVWDDLKLGLKYGNQLHRMAIIGNKNWQEWAVKAGRWFISGEIEFFADENKAVSWLQED